MGSKSLCACFISSIAAHSFAHRPDHFIDMALDSVPLVVAQPKPVSERHVATRDENFSDPDPFRIRCLIGSVV
jgi:hypothetical protein